MQRDYWVTGHLSEM